MDPKGKVALLIGGARIGQVVAHCLAARGCDLALVYRGSREAAEASAKAASGAGVRAITIRTDATDEDQIAEAVKETHRALGRIDILLNMASIYLSTPDPNEADWSSIVDTNARSVFLFSTSAAPIMKQGGGARIINLADWLPASGRPRYRGFVPLELTDFVDGVGEKEEEIFPNAANSSTVPAGIPAANPRVGARRPEHQAAGPRI